MIRMRNTVGLAGSAEIIRAKQKDDIYNDKLQKLWIEILLKCNDARLWYKTRTYPIGFLLYSSATTLLGLQTLGEECTGIVQVESSLSKVPTIFSRIFMVTLNIFGRSFMITSLNTLQLLLQKCSCLQPTVKENFTEALRILKATLPFIEHFHRAQFYFGGFYYQIAKRIAGIRYVLAKKWLKDYKSLYGFKLLGVVTNIHLTSVALHETWKWFSKSLSSQNIREESISWSISTQKCPLCLEERNGDSATSCGHIFCWSCILDWLQTQNKCPICREKIDTSRIIFLKNGIL